MFKKYQYPKYYYIGLIFIHILLLFPVLNKKKDRNTITLTFLTTVGFAFYYEYPLYIFKAYKYKTKILKNREQDNSFGSVLSQSIYVPSVATVISFFQLGWKVKFLFTLFYVFIERLFIRLHIFKNRWWRTPYTALSIFAFFYVSDFTYKKLQNGNKMMLKLSLYNTFHVIYMFLLFLLSVLNKFRFEPVSWSIQPWYYHYSFVKLYLLFETGLTVFLFERKKKGIKVLPLICILIMDSYLINKKKLKVKGSYWLSVFPVRLFSYLFLFLLQKANKSKLASD
ncbi:MAG: hypothetical protein LPK26_20385 [Bacillaceae bacterium]|nr:hypothetical protein [Bacillaceae bacterium]